MTRDTRILGSLAGGSLVLGVLILVRVGRLEDELAAVRGSLPAESPPVAVAPVVSSGPDLLEPRTAAELRLLRDEVAQLRADLARREAAGAPASRDGGAPATGPKLAPGSPSEIERRVAGITEAKARLDELKKDLDSLDELKYVGGVSHEDYLSLVNSKLSKLFGFTDAQNQSLQAIATALSEGTKAADKRTEEVFREYARRKNDLAQRYARNLESPALRDEVVTLEGWLYDSFHVEQADVVATTNRAIEQLEALVPPGDPLHDQFRVRVKKNSLWTSQVTQSSHWLPWGHLPREEWVPRYADQTLDELRAPAPGK